MGTVGCTAEQTFSKLMSITRTAPYFVQRAAKNLEYAQDEASHESLGSRQRTAGLTSVIWQRARTAGPR